MIIYWGGWATNSKLFITVLIGYVLLAAFQLAGRGSKNRPLLEFKAGAVWVLPWFIAMALISWLCDPASHPSLFGWVFLINVVVTVGIYYLAMRMRLPKDRVEAHIREAEHESADVEA
jgi:cell division protein FtsW (lipid II flippase)